MVNDKARHDSNHLIISNFHKTPALPSPEPPGDTTLSEANASDRFSQCPKSGFAASRAT